MDGDQKNLIACLKSDTGALVWKSMSPVTLLPNGNVGIGTAGPNAKLDVTGDIKVGNGGTACIAATAGAIHFNSSTKTFEGCDGTAWKPFSSTASGGDRCRSVNINPFDLQVFGPLCRTDGEVVTTAPLCTGQDPYGNCLGYVFTCCSG
jgi:hypothetical protein